MKQNNNVKGKNPIEKKAANAVKKTSKLDYEVTGEQLLNMNVKVLPYLVESILPQSGVVALAGSSDTGKSSFLRQLRLGGCYKKS